MLLTESFIGRKQNYAVDVILFAMQLEIMLILHDMAMHQQGFTAASGAPEGQLFEVVFGKWLDLGIGRQAAGKEVAK